MILVSLDFAIHRAMAKPRIFIPGLSHHVCHRGNNRTTIFQDDQDRTVFLLLLGDTADRGNVKIHSWALMGNHYHTLVTAPDEQQLPLMMQRLGRTYVRYYNDRHRRTGTLWEGRYRASLIADERYWLTCLRYIETNPVAAKLVKKPSDYTWTSYRHHAFGRSDPLLASHQLYDELGSTPVRRQAAWRAACGEPLPVDDVALVTEALRTNGSLHGPGFRGRLLGKPINEKRSKKLMRVVT
jgi:putative transposase